MGNRRMTWRTRAVRVAFAACVAIALASRTALCDDHEKWEAENEGTRIVNYIGSHNNGEAKEISGVVSSRRQVSRTKDGRDGSVLWTHNDSGNSPYIFAVNASNGEHLAHFELVGNDRYYVPNEDWEDIAIGPGPQLDVDYLYIGDIGGGRNEKSIIRLPEPNIRQELERMAAERETTIEDVKWDRVQLKDFDVIKFRYPGGKASDSESLTVDPGTGDIYIFAKHGKRLDVYVLHSDEYLLTADKGVNELKLHYSSCNDWHRTGTDACEMCNGCIDNIADYQTITAADISPSGYGLIISDYTHIFYWQRKFLNETFFSSPPKRLPYSNVDGTEEALCWSHDSKGYYIIPEGSSPTLRFYPYTGEAWWSKHRDEANQCHIFFHFRSSLLEEDPDRLVVREYTEDTGKAQRGQDSLGTFSECIPVPCSDFPKSKQEISKRVISFFESEVECVQWQDFFTQMAAQGKLPSGKKEAGKGGKGQEEYAFVMAETEIVNELIVEREVTLRQAFMLKTENPGPGVAAGAGPNTKQEKLIAPDTVPLVSEGTEPESELESSESSAAIAAAALPALAMACFSALLLW